MAETSIDYINTNNFATFCSSERKWINKIFKLKESHPDEVEIVEHPDGNHGVLLAHIPVSWMKIAPPKKMNLTDEQRQAAAERLRMARSKEC